MDPSLAPSASSLALPDPTQVSTQVSTPASPASLVPPSTTQLQPLEDDARMSNTWAERNPLKPVQPVRTRAKPTDAQKNSQKISAARNKAARVLIAADIMALVATRNTQIEELATKHSVTVQHIEKLVNNTSHYKKPRAPNLANALVHMKAAELNAGMLLNPPSMA
jgi:hypothetical protein